jgi:hypothetical protein
MIVIYSLIFKPGMSIEIVEGHDPFYPAHSSVEIPTQIRETSPTTAFGFPSMENLIGRHRFKRARISINPTIREAKIDLEAKALGHPHLRHHLNT